MSQLTVSRLADRVGTSPDTVRYYERIGLLPEPDRSASGYRVYDDDAVERVQFIKHAQRFGLRLDEIAELLEIREQGLCPCGHTRRLLERRLVQLDDDMAAMARLRGDIAHMLEALPPRSGGDGVATDLRKEVDV
ncbi:MAG: heavy metal-responsive transcriptional regulator [Actinomycetota bacterium]|nr:heavy metal-responsive transcriptional regulator [Actinomycetota bacterium]